MVTVNRSDLIERVVSNLRERCPGVKGVYLTGSMGRRVADEFSDVDVIAIVEAESLSDTVGVWPSAVESVTPVIFSNKLDFGRSVVFNYITPDWLRFDVTFGDPSNIERRAKSMLVPLHDPQRRYDTLPDNGELLQPSPQVAARIVPEFYRVLALLPVPLGRSDYAVAASGSALLRTFLIQALTELTPVEDRGGALALKRLLSETSYEVIVAIPPIVASRDSAIEVHRYCAAEFTSLARVLCDQTGVTFPSDFVREVHEHTRGILGDWLIA